MKGEFILNYKEASKHFLENETQFHLGVIPTEQSNPRTRNLSSAIAKDTKAGAKIILSADTDIPKVVAKAMKTKEYQQFWNLVFVLAICCHGPSRFRAIEF